eukprot:TRINITY_DN25072_c0_g1_i1.p1 TRINITY_DN25072_c0_g1~~TRINITY_DN25072_c0_g1_i1.p1  ORF type:complete len:154 (+),score=15.47 TRINITY_DN25072_c0_g1_i1:2-463(+)
MNLPVVDHAVPLHHFLGILNIANAPAENAMHKAGYHNFGSIVQGPPTSADLDGFGFLVAERNRILNALSHDDLAVYFDIPLFFSGVYNNLCNVFQGLLVEKRHCNVGTNTGNLLDNHPTSQSPSKMESSQNDTIRTGDGKQSAGRRRKFNKHH